MTSTFAGILGLSALLLGGCVSTRTHERKVADLNALLRQEADHVRADRGRVIALEQDVASYTRQLRDGEQALAVKAEDLEDTRTELQGSQAQVADLQKRVDQLGQDLGKVTGERGELSAAMVVTRARLDDLRDHAQASEARNQLFRQLVQRLHPLIDTGKVAVVVRQGRILIVLPADSMFASGETTPVRTARATMAEVAAALRDLRDRKLLVIGHSDARPIRSERFPSNWELSAARAMTVARMLMTAGLAPNALAIVGQAEYDPLVASDDEASRSRNRRIEIEVAPSLAELPTIAPIGDPAVSLRQE